MTAQGGSPQNGPGFAANKRCPLYSQTGAVQSKAPITARPHSGSFGIPLVVYAVGAPRRQSDLSMLRANTNLQRGPPNSSLIR